MNWIGFLYYVRRFSILILKKYLRILRSTGIVLEMRCSAPYKVGWYHYDNSPYLRTYVCTGCKFFIFPLSEKEMDRCNKHLSALNVGDIMVLYRTVVWCIIHHLPCFSKKK